MKVNQSLWLKCRFWKFVKEKDIFFLGVENVHSGQLLLFSWPFTCSSWSNDLICCSLPPWGLPSLPPPEVLPLTTSLGFACFHLPGFTCFHLPGVFLFSSPWGLPVFTALGCTCFHLARVIPSWATFLGPIRKKDYLVFLVWKRVCSAKFWKRQNQCSKKEKEKQNTPFWTSGPCAWAFPSSPVTRCHLCRVVPSTTAPAFRPGVVNR